jgi:hypothetical protein
VVIHIIELHRPVSQERTLDKAPEGGYIERGFPPRFRLRDTAGGIIRAIYRVDPSRVDPWAMGPFRSRLIPEQFSPCRIR